MSTTAESPLQDDRHPRGDSEGHIACGTTRATIEALRLQVHAKDDAIASLTREIRARDLAIARLAQQLQEMQNSRVWRLNQILGARIYDTQVGKLIGRMLDKIIGLPGDRSGPLQGTADETPSLPPPRPPGQSAAPASRFVEVLKSKFGVRDIAEVDDPVKKMWLDFALSTVPRGEHVAALVSRHATVVGARYLDVGCAHGGFLVAFRKAGASEVVGIDVNPVSPEYCSALLADYGFEASVSLRDITSPGDVAGIGTFDIITCNDVIEHVECPDTAMRHMASLLNREGLLYLEIPNKFSASFIEADGHFKIFGITLLPKWMADRYCAHLFPSLKYDVRYRGLTYYTNVLTSLGLDCQVLHRMPEAYRDRIEAVRRSLQESRRHAHAGLTGVPHDIARNVRERVTVVSDIFERRYRECMESAGHDPERHESLARNLILTFGENFWTVIATKR